MKTNFPLSLCSCGDSESSGDSESIRSERRRLSAWLWFSFLAICVLQSPPTSGQTKVVTWHYNNARTGADTTEKILTPANVSARTFGKLFTQPVDGFIVGQPLYLPSISIPGKGVRNVVFVA